jgi:hypothetical protein
MSRSENVPAAPFLQKRAGLLKKAFFYIYVRILKNVPAAPFLQKREGLLKNSEEGVLLYLCSHSKKIYLLRLF